MSLEEYLEIKDKGSLHVEDLEPVLKEKLLKRIAEINNLSLRKKIGALKDNKDKEVYQFGFAYKGEVGMFYLTEDNYKRIFKD